MHQCLMILHNVLIVHIKGSILMIFFLSCGFVVELSALPLLFVFTASVAVLWSNPSVHLCGLHTGKNTDALLPLLSGRQNCTRRLQYLLVYLIISSFFMPFHQWQPSEIIKTIEITHKIIPILLVSSIGVVLNLFDPKARHTG